MAFFCEQADNEEHSYIQLNVDAGLTIVILLDRQVFWTLHGLNSGFFVLYFVYSNSQ